MAKAMLHNKDTNDVLAGYFNINWLEMLMIERVHPRVVSMWIIISLSTVEAEYIVAGSCCTQLPSDEKTSP